MISHEIMADEGLVILTPEGPIESTDFERVAQAVDPYIEEKGELAGVMICAESFPGWEDFDALISHLTFIRDHHERVRRVAIVSANRFLSVMPRVADHFVHAQVKYFPYEEKERGLDWLRESD
jgi:hypothetical protein